MTTATNTSTTSTTSTTAGWTGSIPSIEPKLDGMSNYSSWKFVMKMTLIGMDVWDCVDPPSGTIVTDTKRDQRALATICLNVKTHCHVHLQTAQTPNQAWTNLGKAYEDKGLSRMLGLMRALLKINFSDYKSMNEYVSEALAPAQKLSDIGSPMDDKLVGVILLAGLSADYKPMVMALESSGAEITSDLVKNKLLQEDIRRRVDNRNFSEVAFAVKSRRKWSGKKYSSERGIKCYGCGEVGHKELDCKRYQASTSGSSASSKNSNEKDSCPNGNDKNRKWCLHTALRTKINEEWYIDSGASNHMTGNKNWLTNYREAAGQEVTVADDRKLYSAGIGDVIINLKNQTEPRTIADVTYVPNLSTNLLSVSTSGEA